MLVGDAFFLFFGPPISYRFWKTLTVRRTLWATQMKTERKNKPEENDVWYVFVWAGVSYWAVTR